MASPAAKPGKGGGGKGRPIAHGLARQANQQIKLEQEPILQQIAQERAANLARARTQMGFAKAAAAIMQQAAPNVQQGYANAANADAGYARGLGNQIQGALNRDTQANNAFLQNMGTPQGALKPAAPVGDLAYGTHGYIPATTLQREGAAWGAAAQLAPGNLLGRAQQETAAGLANDPNLAPLQAELARIAATQPEVYQRLIGIQQAQERIDLTQQNTAFNQKAKIVELRQGEQRLNLEAERVASQNQQAWARIGIAGRRLRMEIAKQDIAARSGGLSPASRSRYTSLAQSWAQRTIGTYTNPSTGKVEQAMSFKDAMTAALKQGVPFSIAFPTFVRTYQPNPAELAALIKYYAPLDKKLAQAAQRAQRLQKLGRNGPVGPHGPVGNPNGASSFGAGIDPAAYRTMSRAARTIVQMAHQYVGTPYVWGGASPKGFDCSGFAQYLYAKAGIEIPRTTYTQWLARNGMAVRKRGLQAGDLVFYKGSDSIVQNGKLLPGHVGIYIGNGKIIDAYGTGYGVRVESVFSPTLGTYMGARRFKR